MNKLTIEDAESRANKLLTDRDMRTLGLHYQQLADTLRDNERLRSALVAITNLEGAKQNSDEMSWIAEAALQPNKE